MPKQPAPTLEEITQGTAVAALGFGASAVLSPRTLARAYGMTGESGEFRYMARMWGTRTAVIGGVTLLPLEPDTRRTLLTGLAAMNAVDAAAALATSELPSRTRVMAAATSALFAGLAVYALGLEG